MKLRTSFLNRCIAFVLAMMMVVSFGNAGGVFQVLAAGGGENSITAGALVANNYELTDAEDALLSSGLLVGDSYGYSIPSDGEALISVDTDNAKITANTYKNWVPTTAYIVVGGATVQTIALTDGVGAYDPSVGNAFSVKVDYVLNIEVPEATQTTLLNAAAWLKQGVANADAISGQAGNLYILEQALPELANLVTNGIETSFGSSISFTDELKAAVYALNNQLPSNSGKLNLSVMAADYGAGSKTAYLMASGADMKAEAASFVKDISLINVALTTMVDNLSIFVQNGWVDATTASQLETVAGIAALLEEKLTPVANDPWAILTAGALKNGLTALEYAVLDQLVAGLESTTAAPTVKNPLKAAETSVQKNMSMFDVTVNVVLKVAGTTADSAELTTYGQKSVVLTLAENATAQEILDEIEASGIVADAQAAWGSAYEAAHYTATATALPDTLTEDLAYTVTYTPVEYTVSYDYTTTAPTTVPYGYKLTLAVHEDATKAYDYTVNGDRYAQGSVYTVVGNTEISRTSGKAYVFTDLYTVVANNYGNDLTKAILTSGALFNNVTISYREPDPADAESLLKLLDDVLTAKDYASEYEDLNWAPHTYGANGTENAFSGNSAQWTEKSVKTQYILKLTNFSKEEVAQILALAAALKTEADEQKKTLDRLAAYYDTIGQLDTVKLGALNGVIDVTDFTPGDGTKGDEANLAMREYFKSMVGGIIENNVDANNQLKIYNILGQYKAEGLRYYYKNSQLVINEIDSLSGYLSGLLADDEKVAALEIMVGAAGYPEYAEKIANLEEVMSSVKAALTAPNAEIDLQSKNLGKLMDALTSDGEAKSETAGTPYLLSKILTAMDSSQVMVQVILEAGNNSATITTATMDRGTILTQNVVDDLKAQVEAKVAELLGGNISCYELTIEGTPIENLVGTELDEQMNIYYTYTAKTYTVKIDGEADQTVSINDLEINLPKHPTSGWTYKYTVDGVADITTSTYTFTVAQLNTLFTDGTYTITRTEVNESEEKLEGTFADWLVKDANGNVVGLHAKVAGNKDGIMGFAMTMVNSGYTYIGLNGEPLLYMNEENTLEICLQTLINAILNDNTFGSETLIALGQNGKGKLVAASMQLGNAADDIHYNDLDFVLTLTSVPSQMGTVANGLSQIKNYMTFQSQDGVLNVNLNLPEKVYEVYLTALLATGNVDKSDVNAIESEIACQFLWDYVELILATDANTTTYSNTLAKLGKPYDLTGAEKYYQMVKKALTNEGVKINPDENGIFDMTVTAKGQKAINGLINFLGVDTSSFDTYLAMIKEYKYEDATITASANANLLNTASAYEALVLDLNASGITKKFDYTTDLPGRTASIADKAAVLLLDDVDGDLTFNGTTILDLNGKTVNGSITANGKLIIVDSYLDTMNSGCVTGAVSGNVTVIGGKYNADVSAFLKDGYKQVNGVVRNALYTLESDGTNVTLIVNTDVMNDESVDGYLPNVRALAVDVAVELAMNYFTAAAVSGDGNVIYAVAIDDVIGLLTGSNKADALINDALATVDAAGISAFANIILADLLDFAALETAIANDEAVATYTMTTAPWAVKVKHITNGDYISFDIASNPELAKSFTVSLKLAGSNKAKAQKVLGALADIVKAEAQVNLEQPDYDEADNALSLVGSATANVNVDLTVDSDYLTVVTVILANGNPANKADLIAALNDGNEVLLKAAIDELTVADVIRALKAMSRNTNFKAMAAKLGVTVDVENAAELEHVFHLILCASGKALEVLEITGRNTKLGAMDRDNDGVYEWSGSATRNPDASAKGYTVYAEASVEISLTLKLFDDCQWGDANHDGEVNGKDATLVLQYYAGVITADELCLKRTDVNGDGAHNGKDAMLILQYYAGVIEKLPVEG